VTSPSPSPADLYARCRDSAAPPQPAVTVLACRQCVDLTDQLAALRRELADTNARMHLLAAQEHQSRLTAHDAEVRVIALADRAHRAERRGDTWYVEALEREVSAGRHAYRPGPGHPSHPGGGTSCVATGCGRGEPDGAHRMPAVVRAEASRKRNTLTPSPAVPAGAGADPTGAS
jgi:hypothetical protein